MNLKHGKVNVAHCVCSPTHIYLATKATNKQTHHIKKVKFDLPQLFICFVQNRFFSILPSIFYRLSSEIRNCLLHHPPLTELTEQILKQDESKQLHSGWKEFKNTFLYLSLLCFNQHKRNIINN